MGNRYILATIRASADRFFVVERYMVSILEEALGFTEGYLQGFWSTNDLLKLMDFLSKTSILFQASPRANLLLNYFHDSIIFLIKILCKEAKNIAAHYDLGNRFTHYGFRFIDDILSAFLNHLMISNPWSSPAFKVSKYS